MKEARPDNNRADGLNQAVKRFEGENPNLTATLRSIAKSLRSMGI
ncbi:DUF4404 family protein [Pseudomonas sp.]|nr:DUF4404 family protein [Pseudomonas sp.]